MNRMALSFLSVALPAVFLLSFPSRAAINLLVASTGTHEILRYDGQTGAFIDVFASGGGLSNPKYMAMGPDGDLYVSNNTFPVDSVLHYDGVTGEFLSVFTSEGVHTPQGLDFGPDGNLYVAIGSSVATSGRINRYDGQTGAFIDLFVDFPAPGNLLAPFDLVFGPDDNLYVSLGFAGANDIRRYDGQTGAFIDVFVDTAGSRHIFGPDGNLYLSGGSVVVRYDGQTGDFIDTFVNGGGGLEFASGLAFGPDGNLYVSSSGTDQILRYDGQTGAFIDVFVSGGGLNIPNGLVFISQCAVQGDVNQDGAIDGNDIPGFLDCMLAGGSAGGDCTCADLNGVVGVDTGDIGAFVTLLLGQ